MSTNRKKRIADWLRLIGALVVAKQAWALGRTVFTNFLAQPTDLKARYGSHDCWTVVTGASSGVGRAYATELARRGFNVLVVARREDELRRLCEELSREHGVKTNYICFDFGAAFENIELFERQVLDVTKGNVAILVHMAGNSDLARHFTDKTLKRNDEILRLQTEGTLIVVQLFARLMCLNRQQRSAIITAGALSAYYPLSGFATANANKAYIRFLSHTINYEFREHIDVMCAHPIAVESEILRNQVFVNIPAAVFSKNTLNQLGQVVETNGCFRHDLFVYMVGLMPTELRNAFFWYLTPLMAKILGRSMDDRPLLQKLQDIK